METTVYSIIKAKEWEYSSEWNGL